MRSILFAIVVLASLRCFADESFTHEFYLGATSAPQATANFTSGFQSYGFGTGYNFRLGKQSDWQLGADVSLMYSSYTNGSDTAIALLVGPTYNFSNEKGEIGNAFFAFFRFGFIYTNTSYSYQYYSVAQSYSYSDGTWEFGIGKRFQLTDSVSFRPSALISMVAPSPTITYTFIPFSFGVNF